MIHIDHYAYISKLKAVDPMQKLGFAIITLLACIVLSCPWVSLTVVGVMLMYTVWRGGIPLSFFIRLMLVPAAFLIIGILTILITVCPEPAGLLISVPVMGHWLGISAQSLSQAVNLFFKALGATACLYALSLTTPMVALLSSLRKLGVPVLITDLMGLIYRFIFVLMEASASIMTAQHARLGYSSAGMAYRSFGTMLTMLLAKALKRSDELYTALEARGYQGELTVLEEEYVKSPGLVVSTFILNMALVGIWYVSR